MSIDEKPTHQSSESSSGELGRSDDSEANSTDCAYDLDGLLALGYVPELKRNRSLLTLLAQCLAIATVPYGEGGPLLSAIYGGGPRAIFIGWLAVMVLDQCVAFSLGELASRYPTSGGPYYWSFQLAQKHKIVLSFINGWIWLIGTWTITLSVNFGFAGLIGATVTMYHPDWSANSWQLLLIFFLMCILVFVICAFGNRYLPKVDMVCATCTIITIIIVLIALSVKAGAGRHSISYALAHYDTSFSGWGGFTFFIGLLPAAYTFSAIGMISSMAEEVSDPSVTVPRAMSLCIPIAGTTGIFFILPICFTLPPLADIISKSPGGQALPYIFSVVMDSPHGGLVLMVLIFILVLLCDISVTVAASRTTWAFARDDAIPLSHIWSRVNKKSGVPVNALILLTLVQMLLGLINIGSTSAFTAFVSVGVIALAISYAIPIGISLYYKRSEVLKAKWNCGPVLGAAANVIALAWIAFELVLFSMPTALPVTPVSMNYSSVVFVGFLVLSAVWYFLYAKTSYKGPPASEGI
ncbi:uncharacterized protein GIQ15_05035 [Arthroderma uncinatum]|uniref:uncharacterized protein n=1 Tax=Arthroderma uncinatum TaxID=74035 RepID=UPI00144ADA4E|nr:uncharacterized protein GIQ15_05035 [Arthroderma uncinatum]KAF3482276.1 hypothetical protein GIQ15_05035 [Arthroderma uncinatum]